MNDDEKNRLIADKINSASGMDDLARAMEMMPIFSWKCNDCGRENDESCSHLIYPSCWRPKGTMVVFDEVDMHWEMMFAKIMCPRNCLSVWEEVIL